MFTGLVQTTGVVRSLCARAEGRRFEISAGLAPADLELGASVCVDGVCLTVVAADAEHFAADAAFETLAVTTLGRFEVGRRVNLEPSLRLGDALGGHMVSGHVDGVGALRSVALRGEARECWFWAPEVLRRYIAVKGSITVDGVSLTVNAIDDTGFMVGLIPHTLEVTTLGDLLARVQVDQVSDSFEFERAPQVNLEVDMLARYVERLLDATPNSASARGPVDPHGARGPRTGAAS